MIYLDNNATTAPLPAVIEVMDRHWRESFANPGSRHALGRKARRALEEARESIAHIVGAFPDEVIFTSGGTEANNMAVLGCATGTPCSIALTGGEHPAIRETCRFLESKGWKLQTLPVDSVGRLQPIDDPPHLAGTPLAPETRLVNIILAHNETGVIQDLSALAAICQARSIWLHIDAVQAVGKIPVHFHQLGATSLAFGAHKFYGPRGVGALLLKRGLKLAPCAFGGHQEDGRRPGTECVALIAGMAKALELFAAEADQRMQHTRTVRDLLEQRLVALCPPVVVNGARNQRLPNTLHVSFPGVEGEAFLVAIDLEGVACSLGSTCASGAAEPAPVLLEMGQPPEIWRSAVRFSVGIHTTAAEVEQAAQAIARVVTRLRNSA
ncbi:MAG: cysteine desulfurase [Planctomycetes bacterium]|nr:cysteine desulfurase [Planctomycetota bacterium]